MPQRKIIANLATSADGFVARPDGNIDWLNERPDPEGFYGLPEFEHSTDAKILGRKTFDQSVAMGARFHAADVHFVFSRRKTRDPRSPSRVSAGLIVTRDGGGARTMLRLSHSSSATA